METSRLTNSKAFTQSLYGRMIDINPGIVDLELYEFKYCLDNVTPEDGWDTILLDDISQIEKYILNPQYYTSIQMKPRLGNRLVMDGQVLHLTRMLFVGLVTGQYHPAWINQHFYFDLRGFIFFHRTEYFNPQNRAHLGEKPFRQFEPGQSRFNTWPTVGYKAFKEANAKIDQCFIQAILQLSEQQGSPLMIAIAGQTAAGKTEIVSRLCETFTQKGKKIASIEIDNFFLDRDYREEHGIDSLGKQALHYDILLQCLKDIRQGKTIQTPRYDFISATSSHALNGQLKNGCATVEIEPADIIFMEGNYPFLLPEVAPLINIKVMYLTADDVRLKRKWKRDMDYRKKYELMYFLNRYFREQFLMAEQAYIPQMSLCDILVDTTGAALWTTPKTAAQLS